MPTTNVLPEKSVVSEKSSRKSELMRKVQRQLDVVCKKPLRSDQRLIEARKLESLTRALAIRVSA